MSSEKLSSLHREINSLLGLSAAAYRDYLEGGKTFRHALILRQHNDNLQQLLSTHLPELPVHLQADANALIDHYRAWTIKWEELKQSRNPLPGDEFVFENDHRFPREAANRIIQLVI